MKQNILNKIFVDNKQGKDKSQTVESLSFSSYSIVNVRLTFCSEEVFRYSRYCAI